MEVVAYEIRYGYGGNLEVITKRKIKKEYIKTK